MSRQLAFLTVTALLSIGCAAPTHPARTTAQAPEARCGAPMPVAQRAWTVEGFGGKGDSQLMMTQRQPIRPCVDPAGATTPTATLAVQQ